VTGEEQGLLGSQYYAEHPLYPLARTSANINMDGMNVHGLTRDIVQIGRGVSTLDEIIEAVAKEQGRVVKTDPNPKRAITIARTISSLPRRGFLRSTPTKEWILSVSPTDGALRCGANTRPRITTSRRTRSNRTGS